MRKMKNKKGGDKVISVYWFLILIVVAGGVFIMVSIFYNSPYDVRSLEAEILAQKVADCVYFGGKMNPSLIDDQGNFLNSFENTFLETCSITFGGVDIPQYYVDVSFYDLNDLEKSIYQFSAGTSNWVSDCDLKEEGYDRIVFCIERNFYVTDSTGETYFTKLFSMVRNTEKNVR